MKNKKNIIGLVLLSFIITATTLLYSCDETAVNDVAVNYILDSAIEGYDSSSLPDTHIYMNDVINNTSLLPDGMDGLMFNDEFGSDVPQMQYVESYAMIVPASYNVFEIMIFKAANRSDVDELKSLLEQRLHVKNNGNIMNYTPQEQPYLDNAEIHVIGSYAFLLATTDNTIAYEIISSILKADDQTPNEATSVLEDDTPTSAVIAGNVIKAQSIVNVDLASLAMPEIINTDIPNLEKTAVPTLTVAKHTANTQILVVGKCAENAVIHIKGGLNDMTYQSDYGNYMGVTSISSSGVTILSVTAQEPGKAESDPIMITVRARMDVRIFASHGIYAVIVGDKMQGHFLDALDDYIGANLLTDTQKTMIANNVKDKVDFLKSDGLNAELIYLMIPNPMNIYPETVPTEYTRYTEDSRREQFIEIAENAGAKVIDLTQPFLDHKDDEFKLFHKTDSHWTYYGAYIGYKELFNYIGQKFPAALPRDESLFEFYNKEVDAGDVAVHQEFDETALKEYATFVNFLWDIDPNLKLYKNDHSTLLVHEWVSPATTITNDNPDLPKAIILRDSFGSSIMSMMSDRFSRANWQAMWDYSFNKSTIKSENPDYYIYVITERNIKNIMR